jgi:signal transduction histidine kinase/ActR/RegA family two-component response regulator
MTVSTDAPSETSTAELPELIRSFDWASTELGAIETWPASLVTTVDLVAAAACPMVLWWGERSIQIYNDAARRALLAEQHPRAFGAPAVQGGGRVWQEIGASVPSVRAGGGAAERQHIVLADQRTWSFSLNPVPDGRGGVGGVLVIAHETTRDAAPDGAPIEQLRLLFKDAPSPMCILRGPQYIVELANDAIATAFDVDGERVLGRPVFDVVPGARGIFEPLLTDVMSTGEAKIVNEVRYRTEVTASGQILGRFANGLFAPLRDRHGNTEGVLITAVDITDEIRARDEARRLSALAESANRAKDEFLAMLGHELRNPLAPISTALEILRMQGRGGRELEVIERQVGHLMRLVDDLLDVSRTVRGKVELHPRDIEMAALVSEALEVSSPLLEQRGDVVEVDVPRKGLGVCVDRERIIQVVTNLLTNAAKYSETGSRITIRGTRTGDRVRLSIRDHGAGITSEMLSRIFDPFVQQAQTLDRARGGLGIGLSIVRSLVELHGGTVSAASEGPGRGSEFTIELPASAQLAAPSQDASSRIVAAPPRTHRAKILVVDDNEDAATLIGDALEMLGYQVVLAHDGPSALQIAESFEPDVALLDIGLPVMDGFQLAERLQRQQPPDHRPHMVAITGYGQESDRRRSRHVGFEHHLVKPVSLGELSRVVTELIASHPARPGY